MPRRTSEATRQAAALSAGQRMIARGDRPGYRMWLVDGRWVVDALPWLTVAAESRGDAVEAARIAIAAWLEVELDTFDVEAD